MDQNKKYIIQKKLEKQALLLEQKKVQRIKKLKEQYLSLKESSKAYIDFKYNKKLEVRISRINKEYEAMRIRNKKKLLGQEVKDKKPRLWNIKQKAYTKYQYCRKLSLANSDWMIWLADKWWWFHWSKCVAWHIYSKSGNWHMAFLDMNVWCITSDTNRIQGTSPWIFWAVNVLNQQELDYLKWLSENKILKNEIRDRNYYQTKYDYYLEKSKIEEKRLWISNI